MISAAMLGLVLTVGAPALKDGPKGGPSVVGEWIAEHVVHNGQVDPQPGAIRYTFTAQGRWIVARDNKELDGDNRGYRLDPKADPATVDFTLDRARDEAVSS